MNILIVFSLLIFSCLGAMQSPDSSLWKALEENETHACHYFLSNKADPNKMHLNLLPLHYAIEKFCRPTIIKLLLRYGADPNALTDEYVSKKSKKRYHESNSTEEIGATALHIAVEKGYSIRVINMLIRCGANVNKTTYSNAPVLFYAVNKQQTERSLKKDLAIIKALILAGANTNVTRRVKKDSIVQSMSPYAIAVYLEKQEIVELLGNMQRFMQEEACKKLGSSIFKGTMLKGMGMSSLTIKNFTRFNKK